MFNMAQEDLAIVLFLSSQETVIGVNDAALPLSRLDRPAG